MASTPIVVETSPPTPTLDVNCEVVDPDPEDLWTYTRTEPVVDGSYFVDAFVPEGYVIGATGKRYWSSVASGWEFVCFPPAPEPEPEPEPQPEPEPSEEPAPPVVNPPADAEAPPAAPVVPQELAETGPEDYIPHMIIGAIFVGLGTVLFVSNHRRQKARHNQ